LDQESKNPLCNSNPDVNYLFKYYDMKMYV